MHEILSAHLAGRAIEYRGLSLDHAYDDWQPLPEAHNWNFNQYAYRVTPKPKVKRWKWVIRNNVTGKLIVYDEFLSGDETIKGFYSMVQKIDSTEQEFDE